MPISRRDFLKLTGGAAGAMALQPFHHLLPRVDFPQGDHLGRLTATLNYRSAPRADDYTLLTKKVYEDEVVQVLREVVSESPFVNFPHNQRWFETPDGYLYAGYVQLRRAEQAERVKRNKSHTLNDASRTG